MTTPTPSLRRRVTVTVLGLFALLLVLVGVAVDVALGAQLRRDLDARLADRAARSVVLAEEGTTPEGIVDALRGDGIRVRVRAADGTVHGDSSLPATPPARPEPPSPPAGGPPPPPPAGGPPPPPPGGGPPAPVTGEVATPDGPTTVVTRELPDGSELTLLGDTTQIDAVREDLRWVLLAAGGLTLALAAVLLLGAIARALRPLDAMSAGPRRITAGDRGRRLRPDRERTELGRAAGAFDGMLDALEAAETRERAAADAARRAEADTRRFLTDAAHELRTPVAGIQNIAESLARDGTARPDRHVRWTTLLVREAGQAARLVTDMLDLARIDTDLPLQRRAVDLAELADAEVDRARLLAPSLTVDRTGLSSVTAYADPGRLAQILANLLNNARRHTPAGGRITVELGTTATHAEVVVTDTGPGVPDDQHDRIFDRLVRPQHARDRDTGGAGLGLTIARGLARAHGGDLTCEPARTGARFRLSLPRGGPGTE